MLAASSPGQWDPRRRDVVKLINGSLLDYQHYTLPALLACVETLLGLCTNAATGEERFQKVKLSNPTLAKKLACKPEVAEDLLGKAGWTQQVVDHEKHYVMKDSHDARLGVAIDELAKASNLLQDKLQRGSKESDALKTDQTAYREKVLADLENDRRRRQEPWKEPSDPKILAVNPEGPESISSYRDRTLGKVQYDDGWQDKQPSYAPVDYTPTMEGARNSYKSDEE